MICRNVAAAATAAMVLCGCGGIGYERARPVSTSASIPPAESAPRSVPRTVPAETESNDIINPPRASRGNPQEYEVMGRRYRVMASGDGYRDTGVASWYGDKFHGRLTSSGERYDMHALTAAHKTLPLPTWVEVTNQRNGRSVIVKVNDRGPFVDDRIIDLSFAAATEIDMVRDGTAPVFVRALGAPATLPVARNAAGQDEYRRQLFAQVAAFSEQGNARRLVARLRGSGFANAAMHGGSGTSGSVFRVRVGPFADDAQFAQARTRLSELGFADARMIVEFVRD